MAHVLLVRHGESAWNAEGRWQGQADPPLTDLGLRQAALAAHAVGSVEAVVASDLQRASVTADVMAEALGVGPVVVDPGWRERSVGEWSGLTRQEIHQRWPGCLSDDSVRTRLRRVDGSLAERRPPGWESDEHLLERTLAALRRLVAPTGDGDVLVITHGGVIYNLEHHLGSDAGRIPNLGGRWVHAGVESAGLAAPEAAVTVTLGDRVVLVDPEVISLTVPGEL